MLEKLLGNLLKPKGVNGPQIVESVWKYLSKNHKYVEIDIRKEFQSSWMGKKCEKEIHGVYCTIADDSDAHRSRSGEMLYETVRIFTFGNKKWAVAKGRKVGNYPGDEYESDIMAVEIESQNIEDIRKTIEKNGCWFNKSLIVADSWKGGNGINFFGQGDFRRFFDEKIKKLDDLETKLDYHSGGWDRKYHTSVTSYRAKDIKEGSYHPEIITKVGDAILYALTEVSKTTAERWRKKFSSEGGNDIRRVVQICEKHKEINEEVAQQLNRVFIYLHGYTVEPNVLNRMYLVNFINNLSDKEYPKEAGKYLPDYTKLIERLDDRFKKELINQVSSFKSIDSYLVQKEVNPRKLNEKREWWNFPVTYGIVTPEQLAKDFNLDQQTVDDKLKRYGVEVK